MKAYSFFFNATGWLASPSVKLMSKAERGCYIDLLAIAWNQDKPGTLPASEDKIRRLAELSPKEWAISGEILLEMFPLSECKTYRYNIMLIQEAEKQREISEKNAENGRRSAQAKAARKATTAQRPLNDDSTTVDSEATNPQQNSNETSTKLSQAKQSTNVDDEVSKNPVSEQPNPGRDAAIATGDPADEQAWNESPLTKPKAFKAICDDNNFKGIDYEHYRIQLLDAAKNEVPLRKRKSSQWRSWVRITLDNRKKSGPLRMADEAMPTELTPRHLLPAPGEESPGQIIVVRGDHDQQMNRMLVDSHQRNWPKAIIHAIRP